MFVEFSAGIAQGEMPPLWVVGARGGAELVNYRVRGRFMIVDRLFAAADQRRPQTHGPEHDRPRRSEREIAHELRLRPERPRVTRLSRRVLAAIGGGSALVVAGALLWGLHTRSGTGVGAQELYSTDAKPPVDRMAGLPRDYAGLSRAVAGAGGEPVPRLGPRLPGDLGRPILAAGAPAPPIGAPGDPGSAPAGAAPARSAAEQQHDQARQRIAQERDAARVSQLFSTRASSPDGAVTPPLVAAGGTTAPVPVSASIPQSDADRKAAFLAGAVDRQTASPDRLEPPAAGTVLQAGSVIAAALITGLRSDLPGQVTAQVIQNVYDSPTGTVLLIAQGARLIGQYDAQVQFGEARALLVWTRLIMPNGRSIVLERQPGADPAGYAGLGDRTDDHWGQLFKAALVSTLLSVGAEAGTVGDENTLAQALRQGGSNAVAQVGGQVVGRSLGVAPTITVRPGFPVRVIVTRDLVLEPYRE